MMRWLDRCGRVGLVIGIALMLQPWWGGGYRCGFFVTAIFTLLHIITSRMVSFDGRETLTSADST